MGYYYNPNIHPYTEYLKRQEGLQSFADQVDMKVIYDETYDPQSYFQQVAFRENIRCRFCYQIRLDRAAHIAHKGKFDYFTSTLLVSKYQKHDLIRRIGEDMGEKYGVPFLYHDFREGFSQTGTRSRAMGLYRQQYCGCLYSEMERYTPHQPKKSKQATKRSDDG
jgi:predicted adenine nucleotide alpha hydrolase (AANH) superfamily ATPase